MLFKQIQSCIFSLIIIINRIYIALFWVLKALYKAQNKTTLLGNWLKEGLKTLKGNKTKQGKEGCWDFYGGKASVNRCVLSVVLNMVGADLM